MKDILGYEGLYQINKEGEVWSEKKFVGQNGYIPARFAKITIETIGYKVIGLRKNGINKNCRIHRLLAENFIPNPDNLPEVNHKNGIKLDNRLENLEWCTHKHNMSEAGRIGLMKWSSKNKKRMSKQNKKYWASIPPTERSKIMKDRSDKYWTNRESEKIAHMTKLSGLAREQRLNHNIVF